VNGESMTSTNF